ncbi:MAG: YMGG-like glycine zipper-containing protein [Burkholderiales bacterium]
MKESFRYAPLVLLISLGACVTVPPSGPSMTALPGSGKSFDQFRASDAECRQYATSQIGGTTAKQAAEDSALRSAVLGTAIGAVAGAAIGGQQGAAIGAGTGLIVGSVAGSDAGAYSARGAQQRYDSGYVQCMYAKGHKVPVSGRFTDSGSPQQRSYSPPPGNYPPPPPSNAPNSGPPGRTPYYPPPPPGSY